MELALRIEDGRGLRSGPFGGTGCAGTHVGVGPGASNPNSRPAPDHVADVVVRAEPSHTVRSVADAVADALGLAIEAGFPVASRGDGSSRLDDRLTVVEAGLVSGDTLVVGGLVPAPVDPADRPRLVVTSGPDAGRSIPLGWGTHLVGRDAGCDLVLSDPQVSRQHLELEVAAGTEAGAGAGSTVTLRVLAPDRNPVRTGGEAVVEEVAVQPEQVVRLGATTLVVRHGLSGKPGRRGHRGGPDVFGQLPFHRTPYFPAPVRDAVVEPVSEIPSRPEPSRFAYLSALLPVVMGVSFALMLGSPRYLLFAVFSPIMVIGNWFDQRRRSGKDFARSVERFDEELEVKAVEVHRALADERDRRFAAAPDVAALAARAKDRAAELWVRDRSAVDFLDLRVGVGDLPATLEVRHNDQGDAEFRDQVVEAYGPTDVLTDVPLSLPIADLGVVGLIGRSNETTALASSLILQAACLHSPEDLVVAAGVAPGREMVEWLKWLPHTHSTSSPLAGPHLVESRQGIDALMAELGAEAIRRTERGTGGGNGGEGRRFPWILVLLDQSLEPDAAMVSRLLDGSPGAGISVVWVTDLAERVPRQTTAVIDCRPAASGTLSRITSTDPDVADRLIDPDRVSATLALETAMALAPVRDASSANAVTAIPRVVSLFTALGVESVDADWVIDRWKVDRGYSLKGPIGHTEQGPLLLDLVEHGPHGLIGGTSGAGKSELVMSLVAGLIAENPPSRVNFLFIDYKGGASSDLFRDVPHTVGYVTNLDGLLAMRALTSLRAELNRRMNLLQGRAKDLAEMIERYPDEAPPSLVIVVDEFATLVKEIPDFVAGMVDIAQRGRSLGIHLLLATQRPSGAVNDNIKANTNLRISLRMLDGGESTSVIGSPDAAAIPAPLRGRGYARLGAGELVAFQSAWSGAPLLAESGTPPVGVRPFGRVPAAMAASAILAEAASGTAASEPEANASGRTQIDALLDSVVEAAERLGLERGQAPWLDVLPPVLPLDDAIAGLPAPEADTPAAPGSKVVIGMIDDPEAQAQYPAVVDLARSGGLVIAGTGGSGKSTALVTAAMSAAIEDDRTGGGRLTIFGLDFASRELIGLNKLPQCGAVAAGDDLEAVTRVIDRLDGEFERRRAALAESVARSEPAPIETSVLLLIDGLDALVQLLEQGSAAAGLATFQAALMRLITEGRQVGIYPILATSRATAVRSSISSAISSRLILRQADVQGYSEAGLSSAQAKDLDLAPGQGFLDGSTLIQVACLAGPEPVAANPDPLDGEPGTGAEPAAGGAMARSGARDRAADRQRQREREHLAERAGELRGRVDPRLVTSALPRRVPLLETGDAVGGVGDVGVGDPLRPVVGLADLTGAPYELDIRHANLSIVGDPRSGRSSALAVIGRQAAAAGAEVWVVASPGSPLGSLAEVSRSCRAEGEERAEFLAELAELATTHPPDSDAAPRLLLIDDYDLLPENDRAVTGPLEQLLGAPSVRWVAAGGKPRGFSASPVSQLVRGARSMVYLRPHDPREAQEVIGVPAPWHPGLPMVEGRGFAVVDRMATIVQFSDPFTDQQA